MTKKRPRSEEASASSSASKIFALASEESQSRDLLQTSKLALLSRQRRRKLFQNTVMDHYLKNGENANGNSKNSGNRNLGDYKKHGNSCMYYNSARKNEADKIVMSEWTIEF